MFFIWSTIFATVLFACVLFLFDWVHFIITPVIPKNTTISYIFPSGGSVRVLSHDLTKLALLDRPGYLEALAYIKGYANHLQAGEYEFKSGLTPSELLKQIAEGRVHWREIKFIEGITFNQMMMQINHNPLIVHNMALLPPMLIMLKLNLLGIRPEGLFFPDTYFYTAGMSDRTILLAAYHCMQKKLLPVWQNRAKSLPYQTVYEALIVASIIEKEAQKNDERAKISGVILRRLQKNMPLQMDSTVVYAMGDNFHQPLKKDNLKTDSLYNTYLYKGLPPTPICMPSMASIFAALHPAAGDSLYFVAKGDGRHQFSANYQAHKKAIAEYKK